jgi:hypothetical protein
MTCSSQREVGEVRIRRSEVFEMQEAPQKRITDAPRPIDLRICHSEVFEMQEAPQKRITDAPRLMV